MRRVSGSQVAGRWAMTLAATAVLAFGALPAGGQQITDEGLFRKSLEAALQAISYYGAYDNPDELRRVNDLAYRIAQESGFERFPFSFYLVDMPVPNAFALPGGQIFVTRGMLDLGLTDEMLAGLLGHEIAHVVFQHGMKMQKRAQLLNILSQALLVGVAITADSGGGGPPPGTIYGDPRYGGDNSGDRIMGATAAGVVISELLLRSYSREFEDEADDEGQRMAAGAGFDPDGTRQLMALMETRLPQTQEYGYWQTHPFFAKRVRSASVREDLLKVQEPEAADGYRQRTQKVLLDATSQKKMKPELVDLLKLTALAAWPIGGAAGEIRLEFLHRLRDGELEKAMLARDYGELIRTYEHEIEELHGIEPEAPVLATLESEIGTFRGQRDEIYATALEVYSRGVFETDFLETFASNYPDAPEYPRVALLLGDAYSRLRRQADAVSQYLKAWRGAPESEPGQRARAGLRNLARFLDRLDALQELALQDDDLELQQIAAERLARVASTFEDLGNGADYLDRYPDGPHATAVSQRINNLAEDLYGEVILYQTVGDHAKALTRIQTILTRAPLSPAAERLRKQAVLAG